MYGSSLFNSQSSASSSSEESKISKSIDSLSRYLGLKLIKIAELPIECMDDVVFIFILDHHLFNQKISLRDE